MVLLVLRDHKECKDLLETLLVLVLLVLRVLLVHKEVQAQEDVRDLLEA